MGASAAAAVSKGSARKQGKKYLWGSERPGVLKRRVQIRMEQLPKKLEEVEERVARFRAAEMARVEAERLFLEDQKALLHEHEELVRTKRFRPVSSYVVPDDAFTMEEIAAVLAENPDADDDVARIILKKRKSRAGSSNAIDGGSCANTAEASQPISLDRERAGQSAEGSDAAAVNRAKPVEAPKAIVSEKPKPAPVHIEASVMISSVADEDGNDPFSDGDWSDFNPEEWIEGDDYPEHLYEAVPDGVSYRLRRRTDLEELPKRIETPKLKELRDREEELDRRMDALIEQHGRNSMLWSQDVRDEVVRLDQDMTEVSKQLWAELAAQ